MKATSSLELALMLILLTSALGVTHSGRGTYVVAAALNGASIYAEKCESCHKADGRGGGPFPALAGNSAVTAKSPAQIIAIVVHGKGLMPAYRPGLSDADIAAVLTYVRSSWGNRAPSVSETQVAAVH